MRAPLLAAGLVLALIPGLSAAPAPAAPPSAPGAAARSVGDLLAAGEAAYQAQDAMGVFEAYGPLIADGDQPEAARIWDRLALAARETSCPGRAVDPEDEYWQRSLESGARTGRKALEDWSTAWNRDEPCAPYFEEALTHGSWFASYAYGWYASNLESNHQPEDAVKAAKKSLERHRSAATVYANATRIPWERRKQRLELVRQAVALAEAAGDYDSRAHRELRESFPDEFREWLKPFAPVEQFRRGRSFAPGVDDPVDACVYYFLQRQRDAFDAEFARAVAAHPDSPVPWHYAATWWLQAGDRAKAEAAFEEALRRDPAYAPTLINRSVLLRDEGRLEEALASVNAGIAADPRLLMPQGLSNRAVIHEYRQHYDEALADWNDMLTRQPGNAMALRGRVVTLARAGRLEEARERSAVLVAFEPSARNHALRAEILGALGDHANAAFNYTLAMQRDPAHQDLYAPLWSAAVESQRAAHCATTPANLLELLRPLTVYVRSAGDTRPKITWTGLRTQWQEDGSLKLSVLSEPGLYLLPDGVKFQRGTSAGGRGEVETPAPDANGRLVYPLGDSAIVLFPGGSFFFGAYGPMTRDGRGVYIECTGVAIKGPYLAGLSLCELEQVDESTYTRTVDGKARLGRRRTYNNGMVSVYETGQEAGSTDEHKWTWLEFPGLGVFHGTVADGMVPHTGVFTYEDERRAIVYNGDFVATGAAREELNYSIDATRSIQLFTSGLMGLKLWGYRSDHFVAYDGTGREPWEMEAEKPPVVYVPEVVEEEAPAQVVADTAPARDPDFRGHRRRGRDPDACYRCRGAGQIWVGGGATQFGRSAPSDLKPWQEQAWSNSSASIGVSYTSGHMETCPRCEGTGRR